MFLNPSSNSFLVLPELISERIFQHSFFRCNEYTIEQDREDNSYDEWRGCAEEITQRDAGQNQGCRRKLPPCREDKQGGNGYERSQERRADDHIGTVSGDQVDRPEVGNESQRTRSECYNSFDFFRQDNVAPNQVGYRPSSRLVNTFYSIGHLFVKRSLSPCRFYCGYMQ